jgi:hypothetical protein
MPGSSPAGDLDLDVDDPRSAAAYRRHRTAADKSRTQLVLLHDAGHELVHVSDDAAFDSTEASLFAPEYWVAMTRWTTTLFLPPFYSC